MDGGGIADAGLTDSYFSTSFIGVNGFGSPAEAKYPMMQVILVMAFIILQTLTTEVLLLCHSLKIVQMARTKQN